MVTGVYDAIKQLTKWIDHVKHRLHKQRCVVRFIHYNFFFVRLELLAYSISRWEIVRHAHFILVLRLLLHYYLIIMYFVLRRREGGFVHFSGFSCIKFLESMRSFRFSVDSDFHVRGELWQFARSILAIPRAPNSKALRKIVHAFFVCCPNRRYSRFIFESPKSEFIHRHLLESQVDFIDFSFYPSSATFICWICLRHIVVFVEADLLLLLNLYCTSTGSVRVLTFSVRSLFVYLNPNWRRKFIRHAKLFIHWHGTIKHDSLRVVRLVVELAPRLACARRQWSIYTVVLSEYINGCWRSRSVSIHFSGLPNGWRWWCVEWVRKWKCLSCDESFAIRFFHLVVCRSRFYCVLFSLLFFHFKSPSLQTVTLFVRCSSLATCHCHDYRSMLCAM